MPQHAGHFNFSFIYLVEPRPLQSLFYSNMVYKLQKKGGGLIQVGARGSQFASVTVDVPSGKYKIKLIYHSGYLRCTQYYPPELHKTKFGCLSLAPLWRANRINILVTDRRNQILLPKSKGYSHDGRISNSQFIIFNDIIELNPGKVLHFWHKEDLEGVSEWDNDGASKFYAYAILQH